MAEWSNASIRSVGVEDAPVRLNSVRRPNPEDQISRKPEGPKNVKNEHRIKNVRPRK